METKKTSTSSPRALLHSATSRLISSSTWAGVALRLSNTWRFLAFHMFHAVYMRIAALGLRNSFGKPASVVYHQSSTSKSASGCWIRPPDHKEILCHTSRAKLQWRTRCFVHSPIIWQSLTTLQSCSCAKALLSNFDLPIHLSLLCFSSKPIYTSPRRYP